MRKEAEHPDLGPCCACGRTGPRVRNIVMLDFRSPEPGPGCWCCLVCGLPNEGAVAVLCDDCLEHDVQPIRACAGPPGQGRRMPIESLTEPFEHDEAKHAADAASHADAGFDAGAPCAVCGKRLSAADYDRQNVIASVGPEGTIAACAAHFLEYGSPEYWENLDKFAEAKANQLKARSRR